MSSEEFFERVKDIEDSIKVLRNMGDTLVAELKRLDKKLSSIDLRLLGMAAGDELAREAAADGPAEDTQEMKSAFDGKHWDEKLGRWVEEKPVHIDAAGQTELDIF